MDMGGHGTGLDWGTMAMLNEIFFLDDDHVWHLAHCCFLGGLWFTVVCRVVFMSCHIMSWHVFLFVFGG